MRRLEQVSQGRQGMRLSHAFLIVTAAIISGIGWVSFDERFGRPDRPAAEVLYLSRPTIASDTLSARFTLCAGPVRANCVVDGDTFWFRGEKIRIADIDAPEISEPECPAERQAGEMGRDRLLKMLNAGRFNLTAGRRDEDRFGRKLRIVSRSGKSLGDRLVEEGLARRWNGPDFGWCGGARAAVGATR